MVPCWGGVWVFGLQDVRNNLSLSYYSNAVFALKMANEYIGGYKLKELTPVAIQNCYDMLDKKQKVITTVTSKGDFRELMKEHGLRYRDFHKDNKMASPSLNTLLKGGNISLETAEKVAKIMNMPVKKIFNVMVKKERYAYETIHKIKRTVRAILAKAKRQRLIQDNWASADFITFPKRPPKEIEFLCDEQAKVFYKTVSQLDDIRIKSAMSILLLTGLRRGELCGLEWSDIDLVDKTISINRSVVTVKEFGTITESPKTETSKRTIAMSELLVETLAEYLKWYEETKTQLGDTWQDSNRLFVQWNGSPIAPATIRNWLDKTLEKAGLDHITVHSLRHTNITMQISAGVPLVTVSGRAGHARTSTTTDIYSHFLKSSDRIAADALDEVFGG
ncbi:MAG: site-specific integrase [Bacillota bacterium]